MLYGRCALDSCKIRADFAARVTLGASIEYLRDISASCGRRRTLALLGVPAENLDKWLTGERKPSKTTRRAIFLVWFLLRHPHPTLSPFDIMTEGRFIVEPAPTPLQVDTCGVPPESTNDNTTQAE